MPRGRPKSIQVQGDLEMDGLAKVKQVQRVISKQGITDPQQGFFTIFDVDDYLSQLVDSGYTLLDTHYMGEAPEGYLMFYVFVLSE